MKSNGDLIAYLVLQGSFFPQVYLLAMFHTQTESLDMTSGETESPRN